MERMEQVEDLDVRGFCAQGIVGVDAFIPTCIASRGHFQSPSAGPGRWSSLLPVERLPRPAATEGDDGFRRGVHPSVPAAPQSWSYAADCWLLPAPTYFLAPPIAEIFWRCSPPAILVCARSAVSESSYGYNCFPAMVRFPRAWTPHEARLRKLRNDSGSTLPAGHTPGVFTPIVGPPCAPGLAQFFSSITHPSAA
jgi:hypothetical protein